MEALHTALAMAQSPRLVHIVRASPRLPNGMTQLLEIAANETQAVELASARTGSPPAHLNEAAAFFLQQVLLEPAADSYRVLGASRNAQTAVLRRHMALLLKWAHPDRQCGLGGEGFDRSIYTARITQAWENLKTETRRSAYDAQTTRPDGPERRAFEKTRTGLMANTGFWPAAVREQNLAIRLGSSQRLLGFGRKRPTRKGGMLARVIRALRSQR